jgi:hypothetical protein
MDVGQWPELVSLIVWRLRYWWLFGTLCQLSGDLGGENEEQYGTETFSHGKESGNPRGWRVVLVHYSTTHQVAGAKV